MHELKSAQTTAEDALAAMFDEMRVGLPGGEALAWCRTGALERFFEAGGLPHRRVEDWKYTDLRALMRDAKPLAGPLDESAIEQARRAGALGGDIDSRRLVFVDGSFAPALSDLTVLEAGLSIETLEHMLDRHNGETIATLSELEPEDDAMVALNAAFMADGAVIRIGAEATDMRPLNLVFAASGRPVASFSRSLVVVEPGARAMIVESYEGPGGDYQTNTMLGLLVGDDAHVDYVKIIGGGAESLHVSTLSCTVGARARFNAFTFVTGGGVVRNELHVKFDGEATVATIGGASLLRGRQHADTTLVATHSARGCQSRELFKSVLDDEARGIFQGRIVVSPGAQHTDAKMMTRALLLSDRAEADSKPELEIFADDVQCGHGATTGALDEELRFYLQARGIPPAEAEALLIRAFVGEAVEGVEHAGLREALIERVGVWLEGRAKP